MGSAAPETPASSSVDNARISERELSWDIGALLCVGSAEAALRAVGIKPRVVRRRRQRRADGDAAGVGKDAGAGDDVDLFTCETADRGPSSERWSCTSPCGAIAERCSPRGQGNAAATCPMTAGGAVPHVTRRVACAGLRRRRWQRPNRAGFNWLEPALHPVQARGSAALRCRFRQS